jgi:hypothetical protein
VTKEREQQRSQLQRSSKVVLVHHDCVMRGDWDISKRGCINLLHGHVEMVLGNAIFGRSPVALVCADELLMDIPDVYIDF